MPFSAEDFVKNVSCEAFDEHNPNTSAGLVGKVEGRKGGEKKRALRARRTRGSNPGPAAC